MAGSKIPRAVTLGRSPRRSAERASAHLGMLALYQERWQRARNRLEALGSRQRLAAIRVMDLSSVTLLTVLASYGDTVRGVRPTPRPPRC
jgi:hypothetical protein